MYIVHFLIHFQPMMDRKKKDELPKMQVGFIDFICMPVYKVRRTRVSFNLVPYFPLFVDF